ncbi:MAG TPA: aminotransferase class V-fold PLP-dependent enzyme, partial [Chloroflexota bacterium]|nr:aminotransferase class V-fold PLP-dependent enzyme [Chloroflexota bacterium]
RAQPVFAPMLAEERHALLEQPLPLDGIAADQLLNAVRDQIFSHPMGNGHPRFFGWVNSPPDHMGILAELLAATLNASCAGGDHAAIYLERCVVRWLMELVGFPTEDSMGLLVSGSSMASLTGLAVARHRAVARLGGNVRAGGLRPLPPLVLYLSEEGHSCIRKAVELLGLGAEAVHTVRVDEAFRLDLQDLRAAVAADRDAGRHPFCVVASAGTVNTGAIDPIEDVADFCAAEQLWLHVDGAYGAVGSLDSRVADRYAGMARADSLALDPHKWLSVPVECGCVLVREGRLLRDTFSLVPPYLRTEEGRGFGGLPWYAEYGFQQTRGFRALKLWMTIAHQGRAGISAHVARHNALAHYLARLVDAALDLERLAPVTLSIVCFRYRPPHSGDGEELHALNRTIMEEVQAGGEAFISGTVLRERFALRACILHYDTTETDVEALVAVVRRTGSRLTGEHDTGHGETDTAGQRSR